MSVETLWFGLVGFLLAGYVVLDGFDIGAGILHLAVARSDAERRAVLRSIGPVWDGNEVWLIAAGASLLLAFPRLFATAFSGFYLPLLIVVWLLVFRALGIELRHQIDHPLWGELWDAAFAVSSLLLAVFYGAALGNVLRGVSLDASGRFFAPLWTDFRVGAETGILDWYTILVSLTVTATLAFHGGLWLAWRTDGALRERARRLALGLGPVAIGLAAATMAATLLVQPSVLANVRAHPWGAVLPLAAVAAAGAAVVLVERGAPGRAFLASAASLATTLAGAAFGIYPALLPARDPVQSLTIANTAADAHALSVALAWWIPGMALACGYAMFVYRRLPARVSAAPPEP